MEAAISTDPRPVLRISWWGDSLVAAGEAYAPALDDPYGLPPVGTAVTVTRWRYRGFAHLVEVALQARLPGTDIRGVNHGAGGATSADVRARIEAGPVPDAEFAVLGCGTNDAWGLPSSGAAAAEVRADYERNLRRAVRALRERAAAVVLLAPPPVGWLPGADTAALNDELVRYGTVCAAVARECGARFVDVRPRFTAVARELGMAPGVPPGAEVAAPWQGDGVHLSDLGNHLVAAAILRELPGAQPDSAG
ncbi:SGNH/GDSL hydrolase family protein [Nocardia sp. NPDC057353]|uniref:SGNH/GDSL hydrolase family protein n=1 Tax=Nocardia sp. NPDC057353 TaxID=3346104 RepID=UPI003627F90B